MKYLRTAVAGIIALGILAMTAGLGATGPAGAAPHAADAPADVVAANAAVHEALGQLALLPRAKAIDVVRVDAPLADLLRRPGFLENVHVLQDFLNNNPAPALNGADVGITEVLALDIRSDGAITLFTR